MTQPSRIESGTAQATSARILINTIPKAGTHLLEKVVRLLPGCQAAGLHIEQFTLPGGQFVSHRSPLVGSIGSAQFQEVPLSDLAHTVGRIEPRHYATGHLLFSQPLAALLAQMSIKVLCILRDPRDIVVSHANYVAELETHFLFNYYQPLSTSKRIMTSIIGTPGYVLGAVGLPNIKQRMDGMLPWMQQPYVYTTYFEKLVGPTGGGSRAAQVAEIQNIARHLNMHCSERQLEAIADQLFGDTPTFRKGTIGDWRNHFMPEHTQAFRAVAGQLLIDLGYESDFEWLGSLGSATPQDFEAP